MDMVSAHQLTLLREVTTARCPMLLDRLTIPEAIKLSQEERQMILSALGEEFAASGVAEDSEPNQRGLRIGELIDMINSPNFRM